METELGKEMLAWAEIMHADQRYGDHPYTWHLEKVAEILAQHGLMGPIWEAISATHDMIEDTGATQEDIAKRAGETVALYSWACSGGQGNRKTRNAQIRSRILTVPQAAPVKAADRICHLEYGDNPGLRKMYMREWPDFQYILPLIPLDMQERLIGAHDGV